MVAGESCGGCDGVPNSGAKFDACGVCRGDGFSCRGCDGVSRPYEPTRIDSCGICRPGGTWGACGCNYKTINNSTLCSVGCDGVPKSKKKVRRPTLTQTRRNGGEMERESKSPLGV